LRAARLGAALAQCFPRLWSKNGQNTDQRHHVGHGLESCWSTRQR
jgi:hypothetical protein